MKTFKEILQEGVEGYPFRTCLENLSDEQILEDVETYAEQFKPKWISVSELLPKNSSSVLIVLEDIEDGELFVSTGRYMKDEWSFIPDPADCIVVTYWMPLLKAPDL